MQQGEVSLTPGRGRRSRTVRVATLVLLLVAGCAAAPRTNDDTAVTPTEPRRPHDPWVFRVVLDGRPRMIVVALSDGLWLAYDGATGGLATAMSQPVSFEGAVYTGGHGPQPTTVPPNYEQHESDETGWTVTGPDGAERGVRLLGYRLDGQRSVTLRWGLVDPPAGVNVEIADSPDTPPDADSIGGGSWQRCVAVTGLPPGWTATLRFGEAAPGRRIDDMARNQVAPVPGRATWEHDGKAVFLITYESLPVESDEPATADAEPEA